MSSLKVGDIGTQFRCTILDENDAVVDISSATTLQMIFQKPSEEILTVTGILYTDGTDGIIAYATVDGDLNEAGMWRTQSYVVLTSGAWHSSWVNFLVSCNLA